MAAATGTLSSRAAKIRDERLVGVVIASAGYPESSDPGRPIRGLTEAASVPGALVFHAGTAARDGNVVTAIGALPRAPDTTPYAITRGYATFGSDGGHDGNDGSFAVNQEAMTNFAGAQLKKAHDVAMALIKTRYRRAPRRTYFVGQSEGGREGLTVAQRFPNDYDGIVVTAPAINYVNAMMRFVDVATALARPGGFLTPPKIKVFSDAVLAQCDMNDGVKDGLIGNYLGCNFNASALRCSGGTDSGDTCRSDAQLATLEATYRQTEWKDAAGNVVVTYPRMLVGGGENLPGGMPAWITGRATMPHPQLDALTEREREIVACVATGRSNDEIAAELVVSPATVRTHVSRAMIKLSARDRAQLVVFAVQSGLTR